MTKQFLWETTKDNKLEIFKGDHKTLSKDPNLTPRTTHILITIIQNGGITQNLVVRTRIRGCHHLIGYKLKREV